jgi:hypothetical protein
LVTRTIRESETLKQLQQKIAEEELQRASKAESNSLFQKLVDKDPNLAGLLSSREPPSIRMPSAGGVNGGRDSGPAEFKGAYSPTFVRFEERMEKKGVEIPVNRSRPMVARTDAENGYLQRTENPGHVILDEKIRCCFTVREHLKDGRLALYLTPIEEEVSEGSVFSFRIGLQDEAMPAAVSTETITIRIVDAAEPAPPQPPRPRPEPKPPHGGGAGQKKGESDKTPNRGLPRCVLLTRDGRDVQGYSVERWPDGFTESDGGCAEDVGEEVVYKINYDNAFHLKYRLSQRGDVAREVVTEKYILGMRILLLGYEHALKSAQQVRGEQGNGMAEYADDFRRMAARGAASTVLALAENLPKIVDASSVQGQEVE